jgi:cysteinyl-tRNA synthetase
MAEDLNTAKALTHFEAVALNGPGVIPVNFKGDDLAIARHCDARLKNLRKMDLVLGLNLLELTRRDLRIRPLSVNVIESELLALVDARKVARENKDFTKSDALRDELAAFGIEVMDGDPLGWEWKLGA